MLQNIHHKTLRKAGLRYELMKAGPLWGKSSQRHYLNNMYCGIFFSHLEADVQVDLINVWYWVGVLSGELVSYIRRLKQIVNNYVNYVK